MKRLSVTRAAAVAVALAFASLVRPAPAQDDDARRERARELYDEGAKRYEHHEYELAVDAFKSAYALSGRTNLLFNIAVAYEEWSGHCDDARDFYQRYLRLKPDATDRADVETRLGRIEQICPSVPTPPASAASATVAVHEPLPLPPSPTPRKKANAAPLVIAAAGLVVAGGGAVTLGVTAVKYADLTKTCPCAPPVWQGWRAAEYVSYALIAAGSIAIATGSIWFAVHPGMAGSGATAVIGGAF